MKIQSYVLGVIKTNCYIISNEKTNEAIILDPADNGEEIIKVLEEQKLIPIAILLTHGHFDHIMGAKDLKQRYEMPVYASLAEKDLVADVKMNGALLIRKIFTLVPDLYLNDGEELNLAGINIKVIHTPGHTIGGVCYYIEEESVLFSGDTLFHESVGRTDLPTGNTGLLLESIRQKLFVLQDDVKVYPGHGDTTTIGHERTRNPYFNEESW